jgi:1,4-dihydroxy-2-naphthoate octaprenyltransferase
MGISKKLSILFIVLSLIAGSLFTFFYSYPLSFLLYIVLGNFLVWFYAAPPIKLSYRRLGEFANTFNGFLLPGMGYFVVMGTLDLTFIIFSIPLLFLQLLFTVGVSIPDLEGDKLGGKITWIVSRGRKFGFNLMAFAGFMLAISFLIIPYLNLFPSSINFRVLAFISLLPFSLAIVGLIKHPVEKEAATKLATMNVAMVFVALILIDSYLAYIII